MADNIGKPARRPRAVMVSRLFRPEPAAASLALGAIADGLVREGFEVTVLTSRPPQEFEVRDDPGLTVRRAPVLRDKAGYVRGYVQYMSFDIPLFFRLLLERRPDVVICEPPPTTGAVVRVVCTLRRVPYAYRAADLWSDAVKETTAPPIVSAVLTRLENWVLNGASTLMTVHEGMEERLAGRGISARTRRLGFGIDTDVFTPEGPVASGAPQAPYFLYAGTASEWQGAGIFIQALRLVHRTHPQVELVYLGQGSEWDYLRDLAANDPRIHLMPVVSPDEAAAWQRGAVASVVSIRPGVGYDFAYPTKIFAALACGTPVVYAGPGPARADLSEAGLGWVADYDAHSVEGCMLAAIAEQEAEQETARTQEDQKNQEDPGAVGARSARLRDWVVAHRSMAVALDEAARVLLDA